MQQEDGSEAKSGGDGQQSPNNYDDDDELIDMDDCPSDDEWSVCWLLIVINRVWSSSKKKGER